LPIATTLNLPVWSTGHFVGAITGIYSSGGPPPVEDATLLSVMAHRGRESRSWSEGRIALGQAGGTAADAEIVRHGPTGVVVVADARIDNAAALGFPVEAGASAGSVILQAYLRWGERCANELIGDFAFAVWDPRLDALLLGRDAMGVKPLYWYEGAGTFLFATDARALLAQPFVDAELDEEQVGLFLLWEHAERDRTLFRRIRRLPGGHTLRVDANGVRQREYWRPGSDGEVRLGSAAAYAEAFRETFIEAVRARTGAASPVAASLSGGVDSSSIVCVARELNRAGEAPAVEAFSLVFPGLPESDLKRIDERAYVDAVTRGGGLAAHRIRGDELTPLGSIDDVLSVVAEPHSAPNLYLHRAMYRAAAARGAEVFLDGFDGDSAVSHGLGRLGSLATRGEWSRFEDEVRAFAGHRGIAPEAVLPHYGYPQLEEWAARGHWLRWALAFSELARRFSVSRTELLMRRGARPIVDQLRGRFGRAAIHDSDVLRPDLLKRVADRVNSGVASALDPAMERSSHVRSLAQPGYQLTLELADQVAAACGVTPRYPYFDRRLIALCLSLPPECRLSEGWTRFTMRRGLQGIVPDEVLWRMTKSNLSPNFYRGLRADRDVIAGTDFGVLGGYADVARLEEKRRRFLEGAADARSNGDAMLLFRAVVLARWLVRPGSGPRRNEASRRGATRPRPERLRVLHR